MAAPLSPVHVFDSGNVIEHDDEVDSIIVAVNKKLPSILDSKNSAFVLEGENAMIEVVLPEGTSKGALLEAAYKFRREGWSVVIEFENEYMAPALIVGIAST